MRTLTLTTALAFLLTAATATADETRIQMRDGPELMTLVANCSGCHSLDYVPMNSVFLDRKGWEA